MPNFRRGMAAMQEAQESSAKGNTEFSPFCKQIVWKSDKEEKFLLFLTKAEDVAIVDLHQFIPTGKRMSKAGKSYDTYEQFISRTDPSIGEASDDLTDRLEQKANLRGIAVAVELEPVFTRVGGRQRPTGFSVLTETFNKKNEDGELEEVEAPVMGVVVQSPNNFYGWIKTFYESETGGNIEDTPLQIVRRGKDTNTAYDFTPFHDQEVDFSNLFEMYENISYLNGVDIALGNSPGLDDALLLGQAMLDKRLEELKDKDRYERMVGPITEIENRFGSPSPASSSRGARPVRVSPRDEAPMRNSAKFEELRRIHEAV